RSLAALENAHVVGLLHDQEFLAVDLHLGAGPLAEQHEVAGLHFRGDALATVVQGARTHRDHFAFLRLLLGGIGDDDAAGGLLILLDAADDHAVAEGTEFHAKLLLEKSNGSNGLDISGSTPRRRVPEAGRELGPEPQS